MENFNDFVNNTGYLGHWIRKSRNTNSAWTQWGGIFYIYKWKHIKVNAWLTKNLQNNFNKISCTMHNICLDQTYRHDLP